MEKRPYIVHEWWVVGVGKPGRLSGTSRRCWGPGDSAEAWIHADVMCILKLKPIRFADGCGLWRERQKEGS